MRNNRIASIEFLRFIFMSIIIVWHSMGQTMFTHGYLPVDFFFILSGVFVYASLNQQNTILTQTPFDYTYRKIKKFLPKYVVASLIAFCVIVLFRNWHYGYKIVTVDEVFREITELFMLQEVGMFPRGINGPAWYLSVLIIGGGWLYTLAYTLKKYFSCIAITIVIFGYTVLVRNSTGSFDQFCTVGYIWLPFLRGLCGMSLGMLVGMLSHKPDVLLRPLFHESLTLICLGGMAYCLVCEANYDIYFCLFSSVVIFSCLKKDSLINKIIRHDFCVKIGGITYDMLLLHFPINILWYHSIGIHLQSQLSVFLCWIVNVAIAFLFNLMFKKVNIMVLK